MAITVNQVPADGQSVHFDLWHVVNTDLLADWVIFDLYIGATLISRHRVPPPPNIVTNAFFNAGPIIRNYITNYFNPGTGLVAFTTDEIFIQYTVKYGEEIGGVTTLNLATSTHKVYNCYPKHLQSGNMTVIPSGLNNTIISERDVTNVSIPYGEKLFIPFLYGGTGSIGVNVWSFFDNPLSNDSDGFNVSSAGLKKLVQFGVTPTLINAALPGFLPPNAIGYCIQFICNGGTSALYNVSFTCRAKHVPIQLHFLNRLGGYDTFSFGLVNKQEVDIERRTYSATPWQKKTVSPIPFPPDPSFYAGSITNYDSTTKVYNREQVAYAISQKLSHKLTSNYVSEADYNWLKQLIASPIIYLEEGGYFYPVTVTDKKWLQKTAVADKMFNLELGLESTTINSQYQ